MVDPRDVDASRFAGEALAKGEPTGWFEPLYAAASGGAAVVPWDLEAPHGLLPEWGRGVDGSGRSALVVGCGYGRDAEFTASLGFRTTAFDISETAIRDARQRHAGSDVEYVTADLLDPPTEWVGGFDLVLESITVQSMPLSLRAEATERVAGLVAPGGQLLVISGIRPEGAEVDGPPWPLTRGEIDAFATGGLRPVRIESLPLPANPEMHSWRATFTR
ncbi:class I SAM-dependent methyltransferase [Saccharopolyspora mangrovi]|uniref:Class I SAM-dependent methyltransferase n=1 Tax=Saccharopolyspora mangrovi TaxID=3082379 RepID=A0ABU6AHV2_9PSEU|nr:class I SAM-dependent methyltransferase [Saccharopolyspora sp. S2-29]MEB3371149.1 class I SAM-dependent methyltransferase [Saccharopolyspora sp. S2-29]